MNSSLEKFLRDWGISAGIPTIGFLAFAYAVRKHYMRLNSKLKALKCNSSTNENTKKGDSTVEINKKVIPIPEDIMEKMVEKIKNSIIHTVCMIIDKSNVAISPKSDDNTNNAIEPPSKENENDIAVEEIKIESDEKQVNSNEAPKDMDDLIANIESKTDFLDTFEKRLFEYKSNDLFSGQMGFSRKCFLI